MNLDPIMPTDAETERATLGAVLVNPDLIHEVRAALKPWHFSLDSHRKIFCRMCDLHDDGICIDCVTLHSELSRKHELEAVGGMAYIATLTDGMPRRISIKNYITILQEKELLRAIITHCTSAIESAREQDEAPQEILARAQQGLIDIVAGLYSERTLREIAKDTIEEFNRLLTINTECIGATTGLAELDMATNGYYESELVVIGARPGNGKTALVIQGIEHNCNCGEKVGFFSSEVPERQVMMRFASRRTGIPVFEARDPRSLTANQRLSLVNAIGKIYEDWDGRFFLNDTPMLSVSQLCTIARGWVSRGVNLIFIDYLQILEAPGRTPVEKTTNAIKALWHLGRSTRAKIVVLSQLKRHDQNKKPEMEDLRESGAIENFANWIGLLWREKEDGHFTGRDEILIPKQRSGPASTVIPVRFNGKYGLWESRLQSA